jgi:alpha-glucosidase
MGQGADPTRPQDGHRNLNFSIPALADWYVQQNLHFLNDGAEFFWNDEGETDYFQYERWNAAELRTLRLSDRPARRWLTLNRAFTPGVARSHAYIAWTGDITSSWESLARTPGYVANWGLAGNFYTACDIGASGATPLLLARWYGVGLHMPIMRVHSGNTVQPNFPFPNLWGEEASAAMRALLRQRYALLPLLYALSHVAHREGLPPARPMALAFPADARFAETTAQWMVGEDLLVAPVLAPNNATTVLLPGGAWYARGGGAPPLVGPAQLNLSSVPLGAVPSYVRAGGVLPIAPFINYTDALPGGPLTVEVYGGANGGFVVFEDDGESDAEGAPLSTLTLAWDDAAACLSWARAGNFSGGSSFVQLQLLAALPNGTVVGPLPPVDIGDSGRACVN